MKPSTIILALMAIFGFVYSIYKLLTGQGGGGLGDFIDVIGYTSIFLFFTAVIIIFLNIKNLKKHFDTFVYLLLGLPMTVIGAGHFIQNIYYDRAPNLRAYYPRPVNAKVYSEDSLHIAIQVDSLVALKNRERYGIKVLSAIVDTIIYSQSGKQIFVVYAEQFEANDLGNDLDPAYLSADERDSIYWHLEEGTPNAAAMNGSFHDITSLKNKVRKFYFNRYRFIDKDSLKENYFWKK